MTDTDVTPTRPTLAGVAREAGVSVATVSKVVNGRSDVAPGTRARIQALLAQHDYVARSSGGPRTGPRTIGLVFDAMRTPNNLEIIRGVTEAAADRDVAVVVGTVPEDRQGSAWARQVAQGGYEGLILVTIKLSAPQRREFAKIGVPLITVDPISLPDREVPSVGATNFSGGLAATTHLLDLGHRHIGFIEGPPEAIVSVARLHGYQAALSQAGVPVDPQLTKSGEFTFEAGFTAALELLSLDPRPSAVVASNDLQALGVLEAARTLNLRVPGDVSVVGFDDMPAAQWSAPPLTTVHQPFADMGRTAARQLFQLVAGEPLDASNVELVTRLVVRKSTAPFTR